MNATWHNARRDRPKGDPGLWSKEVIVLTRSGDVFKIAYFNGKDAGVWQRTKAMKELGEMGRVVAWTECPSCEQVEAL